jgi:hypothetical protein
LGPSRPVIFQLREEAIASIGKALAVVHDVLPNEILRRSSYSLLLERRGLELTSGGLGRQMKASLIISVVDLISPARRCFEPRRRSRHRATSAAWCWSEAVFHFVVVYHMRLLLKIIYICLLINLIYLNFYHFSN